MTQPALPVKKALVQNCLNWYQADFRQGVVSPVEAEFPNYALPSEIRSVLEGWGRVRELIEGETADEVDLAAFAEQELAGDPAAAKLFKQMILRYRRHRAAVAEAHREKTFHAEMIRTVGEDVDSLDAVAGAAWFQQVEALWLPRAMDFLPVQYIEQSALRQAELPPRQYDEKFHVLQAPALFLQDLAYFRAKCEARDAPLAVAFLDIDGFKAFNTRHGETAVDRNLLPRFMQAVEAHVYHHGFAYRQGGDEYLALLPSLSSALALAFRDDLRRKLAALAYPGIDGATTVSVGVCLAEPECPLTDRELLDRANRAKEFAKKHGKDCLATYAGPRLLPDELQVVRPGR